MFSHWCTTCGQSVPRQHQLRFPSIIYQLRYNHQPSPPERTSFPQILDEHTLILAELEGDIVTKSKEWEELRAQVDLFTKSAEEYRSCIAPIRKLPSELLVDIMIKSVSSFREERRSEALKLAHVSYFWRTVALSIPELWTELMLKPPPDPFFDFMLDMMPTHWPLSVVTSAGWDRRLELHSRRWKSIELGFQVVSELEYPMINGVNYFPALEKLTIGRGHTSDLSLVTAFEQAPSLRTLVVRSRITLHLLRIPWASLTTLYTLYMDIQDCVRTLESCPCLVKFQLIVCEGVLTGTPPLILLPVLEVLHLPLKNDAALQVFLSMDVPGLGKLTLSYATQSTHLSRFSHSLRHLVLVDSRRTVDELLECLRTLPLLEVLELRTCNDAGQHVYDILHGLQRPDHANTLPVLQKVNIGQTIEEEEIAVLVDFINARWSPNDRANRTTALQTVEVTSIEVLEMNAVDPLRGLKNAGFDIRVILGVQVQDLDESIYI